MIIEMNLLGFVCISIIFFILGMIFSENTNGNKLHGD